MKDDNKIIHLFITNTCTHSCKFCCNKQYDIDEIPIVSVAELNYADTLLITGGEPFLFPDIDKWARLIKTQYENIRNIYVYTCGDSLFRYLDRGGSLNFVDGVNISPKTLDDFRYVRLIIESNMMKDRISRLTSNRLYVFPEGEEYYYIVKPLENFSNFRIFHRKWQEEFVPQSGIFRRLPILF